MLLTAIKEEVHRTYTREAKARGNDPAKKPLAADDFLPIFSYAVSRAEVRNLNGIIHFIHEASGGAVMGESMYYLCMLEVMRFMFKFQVVNARVHCDTGCCGVLGNS